MSTSFLPIGESRTRRSVSESVDFIKVDSKRLIGLDNMILRFIYDYKKTSICNFPIFGNWFYYWTYKRMNERSIYLD